MDLNKPWNVYSLFRDLTQNRPIIRWTIFGWFGYQTFLYPIFRRIQVITWVSLLFKLQIIQALFDNHIPAIPVFGNVHLIFIALLALSCLRIYVSNALFCFPPFTFFSFAFTLFLKQLKYFLPMPLCFRPVMITVSRIKYKHRHKNKYRRHEKKNVYKQMHCKTDYFRFHMQSSKHLGYFPNQTWAKTTHPCSGTASAATHVQSQFVIRTSAPGS